MSDQYESVHQAPSGPKDARPTAHHIVEDEKLQGEWSDKTVLITGCSSGLGVETAKALFETAATLCLTARDLKKAKSALGDLVESDRVHLLELDLNSLAGVRACADKFLTTSGRLNVLITNAGIMASPEGRTADGFESQFGTNHLAHFLLIQLLLPTLLKSTSPGHQSRVVILTSLSHRQASINFSNLNLAGEYHPWAAYAQSKTANLYTANELDRRYGNQGLHAWAVHPGLIATGLMQFMEAKTLQEWADNASIGKLMKSPEQGAATSVWAAAAKALEGQGGKYLEDCQVAKPAKAGAEEFDPGFAPHAYDAEKESLLWEKSLELVKPFLA